MSWRPSVTAAQRLRPNWQRWPDFRTSRVLWVTKPSEMAGFPDIFGRLVTRRPGRGWPAIAAIAPDALGAVGSARRNARSRLRRVAPSPRAPPRSTQLLGGGTDGACGLSRSKPSCRARTASSTYFDSMMQLSLISLVVMPWMLIPSLERSWNILAATPA